MKYRIITFERASVKHEYVVEAPSPEDARRLVTEGDDEGDFPESVSHEIHEYLGDPYIESITEVKN